MVSNVGFSILGNGTLNLFSSEVKKAQRNAEFWFNNGQKILETLGKLKGGAMKIGQMLSLQEGLMPPELLQVIQLLQKEAPPLPFSTMETVLKEDFPDYKEIFSTIEEKPFASASIGQVHRGTLKDGREVAIKIQYPQIDEIIKSDLKNLRVLFKLLFSTFLKINIESIWEELNRQLLYELDYQME
ncbi:MAG: hypothetical protein KDK45_01465, partial [Leptospiraceae bacterium]|nr:hypothetical protein [Leptospiraceae bacterium]